MSDFFSQYVFKVHLYCSIYQYFVPFFFLKPIFIKRYNLHTEKCTYFKHNKFFLSEHIHKITSHIKKQNITWTLEAPSCPILNFTSSLRETHILSNSIDQVSQFLNVIKMEYCRMCYSVSAPHQQYTLKRLLFSEQFYVHNIIERKLEISHTPLIPPSAWPVPLPTSLTRMVVQCSPRLTLQ